MSIAIVMMGAAMFGSDQNNYGVTYGFKSFQQHWSCESFQFSDEELTDDDGKLFQCDNINDMNKAPAAWESFISWGLNLVTLGMGAGALIPAPILSRSLGRRMTISIGGLTCFFGTVVVAWLTGTSVAIYYIGRFLTGFGCGIACMVLPMYNAEVATLSIRGLTGSLFQFMVVLGGVIVIVILGIMEKWGQGFLIPGYFGLFVGIFAWVCPESPRYLAEQGKTEQARTALQAIRSGDVQEELDFIVRCMEEERRAGKTSYAQLFTTKGLRYRLFIACYIQVAQQLTGVNAFLGFQSSIFKSAGISASHVNDIPGGPAFLLQMVFLVGCLTGLALIDSPYGGRKSQLMIASFFMGPPLVVAAIVKFMGTGGVVVEIALFLFGFGFQMAWGIIPWFYPAELFHMKERETALSVSTFFGFAFNFLVGVVSNILINWSPGGTFMIFGVLNVTNFFFVMLMMKETKGRALEEIPDLFDQPEKMPLAAAEA